MYHPLNKDIILFFSSTYKCRMANKDNISTCSGEPVNETGIYADKLCTDGYTEYSQIGTSVFIITVNVIHMCVILRMKSQRKTLFHTTLWLTTVSDILTSLVTGLTAICRFRKLQVISFPPLTVIVTVTSGVILQGNTWFKVFCIAERWYLLAKPFKYARSTFIQWFFLWFGLALILVIIISTSMYVTIFYYDPLMCFDVGFGIYWSSSRAVIYLIVLPYILVNLVTVAFAALFLRAFWKMKQRRKPSSSSKLNAGKEQSFNYVFYSTMAYMLYATVCFILELLANFAQNLRQLKSWGLLLNQTFGLLNIIVFYGTLTSYRQRLLKSVTSCRFSCRQSSRQQEITTTQAEHITLTTACHHR